MTAKKASAHSIKNIFLIIGASALVLGAAFVFAYAALPGLLTVTYSDTATSTPGVVVPTIPPLDKVAYDTKLLELAHVATSSNWYVAFMAGTTTITLANSTTTVHVTPKLWPARAAYPEDSRALLPFNRIVAYYGNFYSTGMGVLGQYPPDVMIPKLLDAAQEWRDADPSTPVIPAIHYIAVVAQGSAGKDGKYRARMPDDQIEKAIDLAHQISGITFLDIQAGLSTVEVEAPLLEQYLKEPDVELAIDPEFAMHNGTAPGRVIGSLDASDINAVAQYLATLVDEYNLPPKILVVHRFTEDMVTNADEIKPLPEVQIVMDMDGWGGQAKKIGTYTYVVAAEPVQFTGFKLFYKNDTLASTTMLSPAQVLNLTPSPSYIQYQ